MTELENYKKLFGEIMFPCDETIKKVKKNQENYFYSKNGINWLQMNDNIDESMLSEYVYMEKPNGVFLGCEKFHNASKLNPKDYVYSLDNGNTWKPLEDENSSHNWIYHGNHPYTWFRKIKH